MNPLLRPPPWWQPLAIGLIAAGLAVVGRLLFLDELERGSPYVTFFPVLTLAACLGGLRAGLVATVLSAGFVGWGVLGGRLTPVEIRAFVIFLACAALVVALGEAMHRTARALERSRLAAEQQTEELRAANQRLEMDATELQIASGNLRRGEEMMELALTTADISAFTQDRELRYTWLVNPQTGF